jgi:hypothetical protein
MLTGIGPGVASLKDYTNFIDVESQSCSSVQGDTLDQAQCTIYDLTSAFTITDEDDLVFLDESDPNGWPTVNLVPTNPSFEAPYSSGVASGWTGTNTGATGVTASQSATAKYGAASQRLALSNVANGTTISISQQVQLPQDEYLAVLGTVDNRNLPYVFSLYLQITAAFTNVTGMLSLQWKDVAFSSISTVTTPLSLGSTTGWVRVSVSATAPSTAYYAVLSLQLTTTSATNSGTLLMDGAQFEFATFGNVRLASGQTAVQAGMYPTPYCDSTQPGCYVETGISNLPFRQLRLFGGLIRIAQAEYIGPARNIEISAVDYSVLLAEAPATLLIQQQSDYNAIQQAVTYAQNQGFLVGLNTTTYVQTIGSIDAHAYSWQTTRDVLTQIANQMIAAFWVDYYKVLHYGPALANTAPFGLSDHPDLSSTFPFAAWKYALDATDSRTTPVIEGSTQLSNPLTELQSGNGTKTVFTFNGSNPIQQVDALSVGGTQQTVGLANVNSFAQGYTALLDPPSGNITFQTAPPSGTNNVNCTYRYAAPVIIRVQQPQTQMPQGHRHRKIHHHQKNEHITSQRAAIDRANADLNQYSKARPIATATVYSPPAPTAVPLRPGTAIPISHTPSGFSGVLFQIQEVQLYPLGNGAYRRELQLGFYKPDFAIQDAQATREEVSTDQQLPGTVLSDSLTVADGWAMTDSGPTATVTNGGIWGGSTSSTWSGAYVWE